MTVERRPRHAIEQSSRQITRIEARLEVFSAVVHDVEPPLAVYTDNAAAIVSPGLIRWSERTEQDVEKSLEREATVLFERDVQIARKYDDGVKIGDQMYYLGDLIAEEKGRLYQLRRKRR